MAQISQLDLFGQAAPFTKTNGAPMAQMAQNKTNGGDLRHCAIRGSVQDAIPGKALEWRSPPPSMREWRKGIKPTPEIRIAAIKDALRDLSVERAQLMPSVDAYNSIVGTARDKLREHHASIGMIGTTDAERKTTLALHDRILDACCRYGRSVISYKRVKGAIEQLAKEMEGLSNER